MQYLKWLQLRITICDNCLRQTQYHVKIAWLPSAGFNFGASSVLGLCHVLRLSFLAQYFLQYLYTFHMPKVGQVKLKEMDIGLQQHASLCLLQFDAIQSNPGMLLQKLMGNVAQVGIEVLAMDGILLHKAACLHI
jgi:hypothetical protein